RLGDRRVDVLDQLDLGLLQELVKVLDVGLVQVNLGQRGGHFREGQHARLRALRDEELYLLEFLQFRYRHSDPIRSFRREPSQTYSSILVGSKSSFYEARRRQSTPRVVFRSG